MNDFEKDVTESLARIETHVEAINAQRLDHETRLRSVETRQWVLGGGLGVFTAALGWLGYHVNLH